MHIHKPRAPGDGWVVGYGLQEGTQRSVQERDGAGLEICGLGWPTGREEEREASALENSESGAESC